MTTGTDAGGEDPYFASVAEGYDRTQPVMAGPAYAAGLSFVLDLIPYEADVPFTCVELGCGTATLLAGVLERYPKAAGVGLDTEVGMLQVAARKLAPFGERAQLHAADVATCDLPACDLLLSSFMFHHVPPERLEGLLRRIAQALRPGGHFLLLDQMRAGPDWSEGIGVLNRRRYQRHVAGALAAGTITQEEIDARWAFKRQMKADGKDVEHRHRAEEILEAMSGAGFAEAGLVWRQFAATLLVGWVSP